MILDTEISFFSSISSTKDAETTSIGDALNHIRDCDSGDDVNNFRATGDDNIKRMKLPAVAFHGQFEGNRAKSNFHSPTGIVIVDIDDINGDLEAVKAQIMSEFDSCLACMVSPSNDGVKCLYLVEPESIDSDTYRPIGSEVARQFNKFGKTDTLSVTDCLIMTADENLLVNEEAIPDIFIKPKKVEKKSYQLGRKDESKELFEEPEEFFEKVLFESIAEKSDSNYHFLQMAVFDLAKYGFKHPEYDLEFVIGFSEVTHKVSKDNGQRFLDAVNKAVDLPQIAYPYLFGARLDGIGSEYFEEYEDEEVWNDILAKNEPKNESEDDEKEEFDDIDLETFGLIDYSDFMTEFWSVANEGDRAGKEISLSNFADIFRFSSGLTTITGIPGHGKTEFVDQCILDLARLHGVKTIVAGFEQREQEHVGKLVRKLLGYDFRADGAKKDDVEDAATMVVEYIKHVDVTKVGGDIVKILKIFENAHKIHGATNFVIDPFNLISIKSRASGHEKVAEILQRIVIFCKKFDVSVLLIAHPTKMQKDEKTKKYNVPDFYDVKGSSAFFEMSYHGFVVYRDDDNEVAPIMVRNLKVKQNNLGVRGASAYFRYIKGSGRYVPVTSEGYEVDGDHKDKNWLQKFVEKVLS